MQLKTESNSENFRPVWLTLKELKDGFGNHKCSLPRIIEVARNLERTLEYTRQMYNNAVKQRDEAHAKLTALQKPLGEVERVVSQYASVSEPVVASDGFTYENVSILEYIKECARTNTKAYSQLTKEELRDVVVPNQTLSRLVGILQKVRPPDVPPLSQRFPIPPIFTQNDDGNWKGGISHQSNNDVNGLHCADEEGNCGTASICVAELEATLVNAVHIGSLNASQSSNNALLVNNNNNNNNSGGTQGRRWETRQQQQHHHQHQQSPGHSGKNNRKHPCLRVYGHCNFLNDCAFANYPYEACLNHIKGKCRFGRSCKEMHVNPSDHRYAAHRNSSTTTTTATTTTVTNNVPTSTQKEEKNISARGRRSVKEKESSKGSSLRGETNSKESMEEKRDARITSTLTPGLEGEEGAHETTDRG